MSGQVAGQKVLEQLIEADYEAYFVGGMVRDALIGNEIYDADITTSATPDEVVNLFEKTIATGLQHGTVTVVIDEENVEVTTFRLDGSYLDNRHPEEVTFTQSLSVDLARRDFTINAMAQSIDGTIIDLFQGQADLEARIIRAVGNPKKRFEEDALRILRGIRFVAKLGFDIEEQTLHAMKIYRHLLANLSIERIRKELEGIIEGEHRVKALRLMYDYNLFDEIPFLSTLRNYTFERIAKIDDFTLLLLVLENCPNSELFLKKFPLTKSEKLLFKKVRRMYSAFDDSEREVLVQYYFGIEIAQLLKKFENVYGRHRDIQFIPYDLPLESRRDIVIQPKEIIELANKEPGEWVSNLFNEIEKAIVLGQLTNNRDELISFMKERGDF